MNQTYNALLVADGVEAQNLLRREVSAAGLAVVGEAMTAAEAIELAAEARPDLVMVAVEEPLARHLRLVENLALVLGETPLVAVSSLHDGDVLKKVVLAGARTLLTRPLKADDVADTAAVLVRQSQKRQVAGTRSAAGALTQGTIITVFGPKGGVGKTTTSTNLAACIARDGQHKTALVDLDTQVGSAAVMLDLLPRRTLADAVRDPSLLEPGVLGSCMAHHTCGVDLLAAPVWDGEVDGALDEEGVARTIEALASQYDYVVVDTPADLNSAVNRVLRMSTFILLVTSLEVASIQACKRVLDRIGRWEFGKEKVKVVLNAANSANSVGPRDVQNVLGQVFWTVPHDVTAAVASQVGKPVVLYDPGSKASKAFTAMHYTLLGGGQANQGRGVLGRLGWKR